MIFLHLLTHVGLAMSEGKIDNEVIEVRLENKKQFVVEDISKNEHFKKEQKNALKNMCFGKLEIYKFRVEEHSRWWARYNTDFKEWEQTESFKRYETAYGSPPWVFGGLPEGYEDDAVDKANVYKIKTDRMIGEFEERCDDIFLITDKL